jgi:hypothetical protein
MSYGYPAEKFSIARRALMLPHTQGEHESVAIAFHECRLGLHRMNRSKLDEDARLWIHALECFMDTEGYSDSGGESARTIKAKSLTTEDKVAISRLVDDLAQWFDRQER